MNTLLFGELEKIALIIKVLELVDMTMVAQLVWVVALGVWATEVFQLGRTRRVVGQSRLGCGECFYQHLRRW
jgi:uncharacterized membrane protein YqhA